MRKLFVFNNISLDGYFTDTNGDMSWAHNTIKDPEWNAFVANNAKDGGELLFGRTTYDLMASYWPTPMAKQNDPAVAEGMNNLPKVVFSRTLDRPTWNNTKLVKENLVDEVRKMKNGIGKDMVIMGSGSIITQLIQDGLIDEYQMVIIPVVLGKGRTMFDGVKDKMRLRLISSRPFANGNIFMRYEPVK